MFGGLRKKLNDVWSGADFWDEKENRAQRVQAARPAQAVKAPPIQTVSRQNAPQAPASIRRISQPQPQQRTTNQLIDKSYGDGVTGMFNKYVRDTFDANTEADKIRRQANTGLSETYKQEQARKTASAVNTKQGRNTLNQFASGGLAGAADFFGKAPGSAMQVQGRVSKAINSIDNPIVRTGVKLVAAPQTLFQGEKEANKQLEAGKQLSSLVENKKQQSGIGNRRDDNRLAYGAGQVTTQLPAQIATGGLGLANTGLQTTADEANRAQAKGKSNNQALGIGALQGSVSAASEKFGIDKFVPGSGTSSRLVNAGKRVLTEGGQEAQQQFTQNLIANKTYDPNQSLKEGVAESAVLGGLAGGVMSPVADFKAPKRPTTNLVSKPTRTRLRPEEARIWSDYQETLYKGNRMPAQVVNETHNKARQIADSLGVDIITGSPDEIAGRMNPLLEQSMAFQKEPTTSLVSRAKGMITPLNQGGYIQLGAPEPKKLSQDIKDQFSKQGSFGREAMDRLEANKISKGDLERAGVVFDPKQVKKIAQTLPEFKANPVMTYRKGDYSYTDAGYGRYPVPEKARSGVFEFKHSRGTMRLNPEALFGKEMAQKLAQTAKDGEQVDFTDTMKASGNRLFTYDQTPDKPTSTVAKPVQKQVTEKQNSVDPLESLKQEARKFETLPEDIHPSLEAKAVGVKRIAPDRVPHQQLTVKEGIEKLVEADKNIAAKRAEGWLKVASDTDTLIKKYGDTIPARTKSNLEKYPDLQKDFATYDYLKRNTYGSVKTLSGMKEQFTSNSSRVGWNDAKEAATRASVDKKYRELVKKDISKGYRYPDEVLNYDKSFKTATDNRARYEKGLATSFSSDDSRIVFDDQKRIAGGMKRQDGKELTSDQKEEMVNGILQTQKHLGVDIDSLAKNNRWVFAHLNGKNPFLTKNAAGLYRGGKDHASVSVGGTETFNTVIDGKKVTKRVNTTMAHELGHALDLQGDKRLLDRDSLWQLRNKYNSVEGGFRGSKYWNSEAEMTARAIAQYVQVAEGSPSAYSKPGNWNKELFDQYIKPSVEKGLKEKYPDYQISKATQPPKSTRTIEKSPFQSDLEKAGFGARDEFKKIPVKKPKPTDNPLESLKQEVRKHWTTKESAKALREGAEFDYSKEPVHGAGSNELGNKTGRIVTDGKPALYLSLDDNKWSKSVTQRDFKPNEVVDLSKMSADEVMEFQKAGGTVGYNYKTQKYEGVPNGRVTQDLEAVDYTVDPSASKLVIDSEASYKKAVAEIGTTPDDPSFWLKARSKYDVVEIKNTDKGAEIPENVNKGAQRFFRAAKGDQQIVLNTDKVKLATQSQPPKSTFEQNLEQAGVKPKNGLVLSERKNLDGTITQKVRTGKGQVEERVVRDTQLSKLEKQKRQIVDAEARPIYDNDKQRAQKQKDLRKQIIAKGGIGSSDYETFPKSLKRKGGQSLDEIATELGFNSDEELMKELDSYKQPQKLDDIREVVQDELANGNKELSGDYARLLQQIDDRKAELLRYPNGSRVTKNRQNFPTEDEFMNLMSSAEASDPNNKTKSAVSTATRDIKSEQRQAVLEGDLQKAQQLRQQVGQIETGLERKAPDLSQNVDETIKEAPQIRSIKDKSVKQAFEVLTKQYLGTKNATKIERDVTIKNLESKYKLNDAEKLNAILAGDSATVKPMNQKVADYLREFRNNTDTAYKRYTEAGEKMGYVSSYLPRIYKNPQTGQLLDATEFELLQRASARTRGREADVVATDWLVEKDPTKLLERYYQSMDNAVAGKNYLKQLQNSGIVTASSEPVRGLRPIVAEGMQSDDGMIYYAPKDVATKLNNLFGANEANNLVEKALEKGSGLNSLFQSFVLSGGIPNTPINSFGMMQVMKEGMALHPVKAGKAITAGFSKRYADKVFTAKKDYLKMMAANDIDIRVDLTQTGKSGTRRTIEAFKEGKAKGLNQAWNEFTNDSTFSRFMPMLEVTHFENIYKKAIRKNTPERAAQIAAESVKNFYGKTGNYKPAVRGKVVDDFYGAAFFAPRFRESMINFWGKNIKALNPKNYGKLEYRDNQKFLVASALTYTAMTLLNEALNGVQMWDNPDDKKDKLILPADKLKEFGINTEGKDIGIPFLSSIATVPRNAVSGLASLASGDLQSAGKRAKSFLSMPLNSAGDLITNEDYFGNQIVKDDVKGLDRFSQMASYTAGRNMQPWLREGLNKAGGGLSDDLKKKLGIKEKGSFETFSNALESPLRFYDPKYYRYSEQWAPRGGKNEKFDFAEQRARSGVKKQIDSIPGELGLSNTQKAAFKALNTYNFDSDGNLKLDNDPFYQAKRATALQDDGVFEAMKKRAQLENKLNGKPIDPLYSLPPSARRIILWKKTLPQGTSDPTIKQIYGQEWYQDYRGQEAKYFADKRVYNKKMGYKDSSGTDTNPYPDASPQVAQKLDYYYTLPSGTGARSRFLEANPDVLAQWDAVENWKNGERAQVGLGEIGDDNKYAYGKSSGGKGGRKGKGRGGRGGRGGKASSKYDYTKDLFGSGGNIDSNNNTKALRAILAKAMSGKS